MLVTSHQPVWLAGYIPDIPTPFDESGEIDLEAFARLCERQIVGGASALVVGETTGEASTLTPAEHDRIIQMAVEIARGRAHVIAGAGSNSTSQAIELTKRAEAAGADAILSVVPYYNKPMQAGIYLHFKAVAECTILPIILHDAPSRTLRELSDETLVRLARLKNIVGVNDASGDVARSLRLRSLLGPEFRLLCGDDVAALACLACGADGCISTVANIAPELCQAIYSSCRQGRMQPARYLHKRIAPLAACLARENPASLKYALCILGFMHPNTRLPIVELSEPAKTDVERSVAELGDEEIACRA